MDVPAKLRVFDVKLYLDYEAFGPLRHRESFLDIRNGGYFAEWGCGADLSADTIEARMSIIAAADI